MLMCIGDETSAKKKEIISSAVSFDNQDSKITDGKVYLLFSMYKIIINILN